MHAEAIVPADDSGVRAAATFVAQFATARGLDAAAEARLALVVEELVTNLAKYGFPDAPRGSATLRLGWENEQLTLQMIDDGQAFDPLTAPPPDLDLPTEERPVGGLGLHLVRSLAATAHYARRDGHNHLTLTLRHH
jgi:serine/threonine-protein kinase RsbW